MRMKTGRVMKLVVKATIEPPWRAWSLELSCGHKLKALRRSPQGHGPFHWMAPPTGMKGCKTCTASKTEA